MYNLKYSLNGKQTCGGWHLSRRIDPGESHGEYLSNVLKEGESPEGTRFFIVSNWKMITTPRNPY